ncbi:response regulator [Dyella sp.]|uniref:response regulator n=1 Tax=Dyella sp. TaxID=1869338 RepID=UPI002ED62BDE
MKPGANTRASIGTVRILLLEDSALDAELIGNQLTQAGLRFDIHRVWTREPFIQALEADRCDIILADHVLPQFDGDSALEVARVVAPEVPFIFVSGTLTEELAVKALKRGATDYVVKQRLQRLPDAVLRAVAEASERKMLMRAESALQESRERLQHIADALPVLIAHVDNGQHYGFNNKAYEDWFGVSTQELLGMHLSVLAGSAYTYLQPLIERALAGERMSFESVLPHRDGSSRPVHIDYIPAHLPDGSPSGYYALIQDISARKAAEAALKSLNESLETQVQERTLALRQSEATLHAMFETSFQHQALLSVDGTVLDANSASLDSILATRDEVIGKPFWATPWFAQTQDMPAQVRQMVTTATQGGEVRQEIAIELPTGRRSFDFSMRPLRNVAGNIVAIVSEAVETTERRAAEEALRQSQKMEAVGQLTGGIAHDFNNLLTVIRGNIEMVRGRVERQAGSDTLPLRALDNALRGTERAAALTQRLLAFSRRQPLQPRALDLNRLVVGMSELMRRSLGETVELVVNAGHGLWRAEADPNQLEAAILNLAVNARDAMPDGGRLVIETANVLLDRDYLAQQPDVLIGPYVCIAVTDTGSGMSAETLARAYEPFFTTKEVGRGTGLGLSMVYGFIRQSNGHMQIESEPDRGTTVKLFLPRLLRETAADDDEPVNVAPPSGSGGETILVVEDDEDVRTYSVEYLRSLGYRVLEAADGPSALALLERDGAEVRLLFTDVVMPGMSGRELAVRARERHASLRVLYASGYTRDVIAQSDRLDPDITIVAKPFSQATLATMVREALDRDARGSRAT